MACILNLRLALGKPELERRDVADLVEEPLGRRMAREEANIAAYDTHDLIDRAQPSDAQLDADRHERGRRRRVALAHDTCREARRPAAILECGQHGARALVAE